MHLVLIGHGDIVACAHCVVAGPLAARLSDAAGRSAHGRAGSAEIETGSGQLFERRFQLVGLGTEKYDVAGSPMHVGQARAVPFPDIAQSPQRRAGIEPTRGLIHAQSMKLRDLWKLVRHIAVAADNLTPPPYPKTPTSPPCFQCPFFSS